MQSSTELLSATVPSPARRKFLTQSIAVAAGVATVGLLASSAKAVTPALTFADIPGTGDVKVLNYALALEDLESDLYVQAVLRLTGGGTNKLGVVIPGLNLGKKEPDVVLAKKLVSVESQHAAFLRSSLGKAAIPTFKYNFGIEKLSRKALLTLIASAETTGVRAYTGAITHFANRKYLRAAGAILGVEARHATEANFLRNSLFRAGVDVAPQSDENNGKDTPMEPDAVLKALSPVIVVS